jgi:hypothetical protein
LIAFLQPESLFQPRSMVSSSQLQAHRCETSQMRGCLSKIWQGLLALIPVFLPL